MDAPAALDRTLDQLCGDHLVRTLQDLVRTDTTYPPGREHRLAELISSRLGATGLSTTVHPFGDGRANLTGRLAGSGQRRALGLVGHLDTAPVGHEAWQHPPHAALIANGRLYGRGAADMKGGLAAMMVAVEALARAGVELPGDVVLAFTSGETRDCVGARKLVAEGHLDDVDAVMIGEPTGLDVGIAEMAALWLRVTATGRSGHTAQPVAGTNAIETMTRFLARVLDLDLGGATHPLLASPTLAVGTIRGGVSVNVTPDSCVAELDLRLLPDQQPDDVIATLTTVAPHEVSVERTDFKPAVVVRDDDSLVRAARAAHQHVLGRDRRPIGLPYYTDAAVICHGLDIPMVILGPGGHGSSHQVDEYCDLNSLAASARLYAHTIVEFMADPAGRG